MSWNAGAPANPTPSCSSASADAARSLDRAFIGTIHAFCAQLLRRRPVEARIDPVFQELAQPDALRVFAGVFRRWIEKKLSAPSPALSRALARLAWRAERDSGEPLDELRKAAWNLAEWRDFDQPWEKRPFARDAHLAALVETAEATLRIRSRTGQLPENFRPLREFVLRVQRAREAGLVDADRIESEVLRLPTEMRWVKGRDALAAAWEELKLAIEAFRQPADADLAAHLRDELWEVVGLYQQEKSRAGQLDFMDLLLCARDLLRHDGARADLQRVYQRIFVDEFQDTDPLQAEILLLLAAGDPAERDWRKARPAPGKLYVVGDPKQSIYRFRRADARLFHRICHGLRGDGVGARELTSSTRSTQAIQSFVNAAFENSIENYLPLEGGVEGPAGQPAIVALPMPYPYGTRNISNVKIDACSPNAVAAFIQWLCNESGWKVRDRATKTWVGVRPEHVCILFRRFTNFGTDLTQEYVRCLEARGIAHLLVGSKSFHRREEVGTLRTALRAIEWPDDELSVFAVLRGSLYAVLDDTLLRFKNAYGRFHPMMELPEEIDIEFAPIREGLQLLRELHRVRNYRPIADTIHGLLEATRAHAGFAFRKGGERVLANVYRLTDLARSFEAGGAATSFRAFVEYLESEYDGSDTSEAPVLEQEGGGVQLMTVHKAKGLEFPVVILADLTAKLTGPQGADRISDPNAASARSVCCGARRGNCWMPRQAEAKADEEEALRVAYVAATRARDLLVVAAIGEEERAGGWLSPLHDALYPPKEAWRIAAAAPGCPPFGGTHGVEPSAGSAGRSLGPAGPALSQGGRTPGGVVRPGGARPRRGAERWRGERGRPQGHAAAGGRRAAPLPGMARPPRAPASRAAACRVSAPARSRRWDAARATPIAVETITLPIAPGRPGGRKFGRLVHDMLQHAGRRRRCGNAGRHLGPPSRRQRIRTRRRRGGSRGGAGARRPGRPCRSPALSRASGDGASR